MVSNVPEHRKAAMFLMEKIHMLDKVCSDMSYSAAGHQSSVNESTIYIKKCV